MIFNSPYNVIIIEDDPSIHDLLNLLLKKQYGDLLKIESFTNFKEARSSFKEKFIHIAIVDLKLENENGLDIAKEVRNFETKTTFIAISADVSLTTAFQCFNHGVDFQLKKPLLDENLFWVMDKCIEILNYWKNIVVDRSTLKK